MALLNPDSPNMEESTELGRTEPEGEYSLEQGYEILMLQQFAACRKAMLPVTFVASDPDVTSTLEFKVINGGVYTLLERMRRGEQTLAKCYASINTNG